MHHRDHARAQASGAPHREKGARSVFVLLCSCFVQWRVAIAVYSPRVGACAKKHQADCRLPREGGTMERSGTSRGPGIHARAMTEEERNTLGVTRPCGIMQRCVARAIARAVVGVVAQ
jgi:hypothetical protein